jgi:hypothetical protein
LDTGLVEDLAGHGYVVVTMDDTHSPERAYIEAFFGKYLRNRDNHLLDGPSPRFPDISFEP